APAIDVHPVGAVEVLDDAVHRAHQNDGVVAADGLGVDLQIVVGSTSNTGSAAQNVDHLPPLLGVGQHAQRALEYRLRSGGGVGGRGGIAPLVGGGVGCCVARLPDGGAKLKIGLLELLDAGVAHARLRLETMDGILGGPQVSLELAGA